MSDITIKEHTSYYSVFNKDCKLDEYRKDNIEDMQLFTKFLIDELYKAEAKQSCWFEKYWECKKQLNQITDILKENTE